MKTKQPHTTKTLDFEFKAEVNEAGVIKGYVSMFGNRDSHNEIVMPGAFSNSLAKHKREGSYPLMLWQHNTSEPIGIWNDMHDDGKGLYGDGQLLIGQNVPEADKVYSLAKAKAVRGMSIGYREVDIEPGANGEATKLIELDLMEVSIVSFPSNRRALIESVKSEEADKQIALALKFQSWARRMGDGEAIPPSEFEDCLRDAGVSKDQRKHIASRVHVALRRDVGEKREAVNDALSRLEKIAAKF